MGKNYNKKRLKVVINLFIIFICFSIIILSLLYFFTPFSFGMFTDQLNNPKNHYSIDILYTLDKNIIYELVVRGVRKGKPSMSKYYIGNMNFDPKEYLGKNIRIKVKSRWDENKQCIMGLCHSLFSDPNQKGMVVDIEEIKIIPFTVL